MQTHLKQQLLLRAPALAVCVNAIIPLQGCSSIKRLITTEGYELFDAAAASEMLSTNRLPMQHKQQCEQQQQQQEQLSWKRQQQHEQQLQGSRRRQCQRMCLTQPRGQW
jgi:hypothetical protein